MNTVQFFKCMSDETRLLSTLLIHEVGELCVCELMEALSLSQPKVSRHLAQLRACGVLLDRRQDQWVYYSLHPDLNGWARGVLQETCKDKVAELKPLIDRAKGLACTPSES